MRQAAAMALTLALGVAAALALVSCGGEDAKLLPGSTAQEITENLDTVKQLADEGECLGASEAAAEVSVQVESVEGVDPELKQALQQGVARLGEVVTTCEETTTEAVAPDTETTTEDSEPPGQEKKAEKEREKEEKEAEKEAEPPSEQTTTETTPTEPPTTPSPPASEDGGTGAPGGVSPSAPVEPEED